MTRRSVAFKDDIDRIDNILRAVKVDGKESGQAVKRLDRETVSLSKALADVNRGLARVDRLVAKLQANLGEIETALETRFSAETRRRLDALEGALGGANNLKKLGPAGIVAGGVAGAVAGSQVQRNRTEAENAARATDFAHFEVLRAIELQRRKEQADRAAYERTRKLR